MKILSASLVILIAIGAIVFYGRYDKKIPSSSSFFNKPKPNTVKKTDNLAQIKIYANKAKRYTADNGLNAEYCFLINMHIPSGRKRFFVYSFSKDSICHSGLVTHGGGSQTTTDDLIFNNTPNGHASSLGKYKIGAKYNGRFGTAYKLSGMEHSNSKAFERFVVLHAHDCVPDNDIHPLLICTSQGCPTVSPTFLNTLQPYLDNTTKPILLWIFY